MPQNLGEGGLYYPSPPARRFAGALSFPTEVRGKALAVKNLGAFWVLQVSCLAVLLCTYAKLCVGPYMDVQILGVGYKSPY